jgi:hypothetical protein
VVWNVASHHPDKTAGVASLCVPYLAEGFTLENIVALENAGIRAYVPLAEAGRAAGEIALPLVNLTALDAAAWEAAVQM